MTTTPSNFPLPPLPFTHTPQKPSKSQHSSSKDTDIRSGESPSILEQVDAQTLFQNFDSWVRVETEESEQEEGEVRRQLDYEDRCLQFESPENRRRDQEAHQIVIRPFTLSPMKVLQEEEEAVPSREERTFSNILIENGWCRCVNSDQDSD